LFIIDVAMSISIELYKPGYYKTLVSLWEASLLPYKPMGRDDETKIEAEMLRGSGIFLFAKYNQTFIGTVLATHDGRKGWINRVAVLPSFRKQGVARKLVQAAEKWLEEQGIEIFACQNGTPRLR